MPFCATAVLSLEPTSSLSDVVSSWQSTMKRKTPFRFQRDKKKQIRFQSALIVGNLNRELLGNQMRLASVTSIGNPSANSRVCPCWKGSLLSMLAVCNMLCLHTVWSGRLWWDLCGGGGLADGIFIQLYTESAAVDALRDAVLLTMRALILWSLTLSWEQSDGNLMSLHTLWGDGYVQLEGISMQRRWPAITKVYILSWRQEGNQGGGR